MNVKSAECASVVSDMAWSGSVHKGNEQSCIPDVSPRKGGTRLYLYTISVLFPFTRKNKMNEFNRPFFPGFWSLTRANEYVYGS
jgi:hypothetical protein